MKKDKEWLKEELVNDLMRFNGNPNMTDYEEGMASGIMNAINLTEKLDEPETLSQEWIDENKVARINDLRKMTTNDVVTVGKLKNLLVPKQDKQEVEEKFYTFDNARKWLQENGFVVFEKDKLDAEVQRMIDETYKAMNEKPVIPQFVADWIDTHNLYGNNPLREYRDLENDFNEGWTDEEDAAVYHWVNENPYAFTDALRYGYEVEKEKKYRVVFPYKWETVYLREGAHGDFDVIETETYGTQYTEAEIKAIDERYWAFAEEVTE